MKSFLTSLIAAASLFAGAAQAHSFHSSSTITGENGNVWQRSGSTTFGGGYASHQGSVTTPNGQTYNRNGSATYAPGAVASQSTITGPNGEPIVTREGSTTYSNGSYNHTTTYTGANGQTYGYSSTGTYGAGQ
jgi:hypothetical protein